MSTETNTQTTRISRLPLVRTLARALLPALLATRITPNQITFASLLFGIGACVCYLRGNTPWTIIGAMLFIACYVLDNYDGDVARNKALTSRSGALFDTSVDSVVHVLLFAAMGAGLAHVRDETLWLWLGLSASLGAAINSTLAIAGEVRNNGHEPNLPGANATQPHGANEWILFALRELGRADFCFLLAVATFADIHNWLLASSAAGAHLYWMSAFHKAARRFHV